MKPKYVHRWMSMYSNTPIEISIIIITPQLTAPMDYVGRVEVEIKKGMKGIQVCNSQTKASAVAS